MPWDPAQYLKFADHRLRPAIDLLNRIPLSDPGEIYDLGAGAGNVTRQIKERWPSAHITGVDESEAMLAKAAMAHELGVHVAVCGTKKDGSGWE